jgi:NAD-dependent dihydropyrimidine dehydrogenase PreA subunit
MESSMAPYPILKAFPDPELISLPRGGRALKRGIKKGRPVALGETLALGWNAGIPDLVSPLPGRVRKVTGTYVDIEVDPASGAEPWAPVRFKDMGPVEAASSLKRMGLRPPAPPAPGEPVIISGFDPEPSVRLCPALWEDQRSTLEAGLRLLNILFPGKPLLIALPKGVRTLSSRDCAPVYLNLKYPKTLPVFLKKRLLRTYDPLERGLVSSVKLFLLGSSFRSGKTPSHYPIFIQKIASQVSPGLSPARLLSLMNLTVRDGDAVVLGSLERGLSTGRIHEGLSSKFEGIFLIKNSLPPAKGTCSLCGRCKKACPQGLPVDLLGAYPERKWKEIFIRIPDLYNCPACGLCALSCPENIALSSLRSLWGDQRL